jgi:hypothetical protein
MSIIMYALISLILHLMWMIFGGKGDIEDSFRTVVYGSSPYILLSWIPLAEFIIGLYCLYLITIGGAITHKISNMRSLLAIIIIPAGLIILFSALLINFLPYLYQYVSQVLSNGVIDLNNTGINNSLFYY